MNLILSALSRKLGEFKEKENGWADFECLWDSHKSAKLGINLNTMRYSCLSCHRFGDVTDLLKELGIHLEYESGKPHQVRRAPLPAPPATIPAFIPFAQLRPGLKGSPSAIFFRDCQQYALKRGGLTLEDMAEMGWGTIEEGFYASRLVVPIYMDGVLVNFLARSIYDFLSPKELPGQIKDGWWPRSELCYGLDDVHEGDDLVLVEGLWDRVGLSRVLTAHAVVSLLGSHLSPSICGRILAKKPRTVTLFLDGDDAGRAGTEGAVSVLRRRKYSRIYIVDTPDGKDPDEITAQAEQLVRQARHWMKH